MELLSKISGAVLRGAPFGDLHLAPRAVRVEEHEQVRSPVALVFAVVALKLTRLGQTYVPGGPLASHPVPTPFQSGPNVTGVFLTQNIDSPTAGFSSSPTGTPLLNGFTATLANTTFQALPVVTALGLANNTLNIGDDLEATGAAAGATSLVYTTTPMAAANPAFAQNVTMNGVNQATITNAFAGVGGFQGANISGLLIENNPSPTPASCGCTPPQAVLRCWT